MSVGKSIFRQMTVHRRTSSLTKRSCIGRCADSGWENMSAETRTHLRIIREFRARLLSERGRRRRNFKRNRERQRNARTRWLVSHAEGIVGSIHPHGEDIMAPKKGTKGLKATEGRKGARGAPGKDSRASAKAGGAGSRARTQRKSPQPPVKYS